MSPFGYSCRTSSSDIHDSHRHRVGRDRELHAASQCEGNELTAKSKALRNWLTDFSSLDERPPTDVKVWGEFMVYAYLFGVADQAIKQLQTTMPQLFEYDGSMGMTYMPWWFWYTGAIRLPAQRCLRLATCCKRR